ncbi:MAG: hypothetical protein RUDDFDWM_001446 [Candidatus Fervidibacterota bacterium]
MSTRRRALGKRQLAMLCRQFGVLYSAGVDMLRILKVLRQQTEDERLVEILLSLEKDLRMGRSLAAGLARFPTVFSPMFISMVRQGEREGVLDEMMFRLAEHLEREAEFESDFIALGQPRGDVEITFERFRPLLVWLTIICGVISVAIAWLWYTSLIGLVPIRYLGPNISLLVGVLMLSFALLFLRYKPPRIARCSFCGGTEAYVGQLIPGEGGVWICEGCIAKSAQVLKEHRLAQMEAMGKEPELEPEEEAEKTFSLEEGEMEKPTKSGELEVEEEI